MESKAKGETWNKRPFEIYRPQSYKGEYEKIRKKLLDALVFLDTQIGYAMVRHIGCDKVEILKTSNGGDNFVHLTDFRELEREGDDYGLLNYNLEILLDSGGVIK